MVKLKKNHYYVNKNKNSRFVKEIIPMTDLELPDSAKFDFEDMTDKKLEESEEKK